MQEAVETSCFCVLEHEQATSLVIGLFSDVSFERPNKRCDSQLASAMAFQPVINVNHINRCSAQPLGTGLAPGRLWAHYRCSWHGGAAFLAFSLCPLTVVAALAPLLLVALRKEDGVREGGGDVPQCSPNPPKWNWQAPWSNCSQHYFLWQEILLSTNRGFNKLQEMRL